MDNIIEQSRLMELTGLRQKAALRRALRRAGIPFKEVAGRLLTTEEAFTASLVGRGKKKKEPNWGAIHASD